MNVVILGKTAAGKSTVIGKLRELGYIPIVEYTTRPMREGETDGLSYHFITDSEYDDMERRGLFAESLWVETVHGLWKYGALKSDFDGNNRVVTMGPRQFFQILESHVDICSILIDITDKTALGRTSMRGDSRKEVERRLKKDNPVYDKAKEYVTYIVDGNKKNADEIASKIFSMLQIAEQTP